MGISGLLTAIRRAQWIKITQLRGSSFVIDGHCFLHAAAILDPKALVLKNNISGVIDVMVQLVGSILPSATFVTLVFDGGSLPSKTFTNSRRKQARDASLALAEAYSSAGDSEEAENALKKAISFSNLQVSRIANGVFKRLEKHDNFAVLIAPYEADAQVAYLQKLGMGDVIVTNDSDILLYGPRKALYKYNWRTGTGFLSTIDDLYLNGFESLNTPKVSSRVAALVDNTEPNRIATGTVLARHLRFQQACILSGCDYTPSLVGVGLITSVNTVGKTDGIVSAAQILRYGHHKKLPGDVESFDEYVHLILQAYLTFRYHHVFDPLSFEVVPFHPFNEEDGQLIKFLNQWCYGAPFTPFEACLACTGILHPLPFTRSIDNSSPECPPSTSRKPRSDRSNLPVPLALQYQTLKEAQNDLRKRSTDDSTSPSNAADLCTVLYRHQLDYFDEGYIDRCFRSLQRLHYAAARSALRKPVSDMSFPCSTTVSLASADGLQLLNGSVQSSSNLYTDPINILSFRKAFSNPSSDQQATHDPHAKMITAFKYDAFTSETITHNTVVSHTARDKLAAVVDECFQTTQLHNHSALSNELFTACSVSPKKDPSSGRKPDNIFSLLETSERETRNCPTISSKASTEILSSPLAYSCPGSFHNDVNGLILESSGSTNPESVKPCENGLPPPLQSDDNSSCGPRLHKQGGFFSADLHVFDE
ncbi:Exonuclease 1 [Giardia duodenalis]|uniref:Exonuclease 1 n=1 Tax=Giardia intestinalis (strain ATCC 50803 / WB clone C6) TaxID=184922 RepID=A8BQ11_GIAIC|nr:Exonuclease 1 [Giardia intestinalis]KAE8304086.1 Exonuclease 1 [Giardia intestinalis]|eukprot:XP_001705564.1 Exonuclease 1 [Giardia lamblia ATCC 50803]